MVFTGSGEEESMPMATEKSKPLHNFMLPSLKWGSQRHLRCMKVPTDAQSPPPAPPVTQNRELESSLNNARSSDKKQKRIIKPPIQGNDGIDAVRERLIFDLKTETDRMKDVILGKEVVEENADDEEVVAAAMMAVAKAGAGAGAGEGSSATPAGERPWNLRTRNKGVAIGESGKGLLKFDENKPNSSPSKKPEKTEKVKFSISLTKKEIEEDFMQLFGHKPPRRPKRRPRNVQRQLDVS